MTLTATNAYGTDIAEAVITVGEPPTAAFTPSATDVKIDEVIAFTNASTGTPPLSYEWDFGDGITSTLESPTHAYAAAGTYTVTLTATNAYGTDTTEAVITVKLFKIYLPLVSKNYTAP